MFQYISTGTYVCRGATSNHYWVKPFCERGRTEREEDRLILSQKDHHERQHEYVKLHSRNSTLPDSIQRNEDKRDDSFFEMALLAHYMTDEQLERHRRVLRGAATCGSIPLPLQRSLSSFLRERYWYRPPKPNDVVISTPFSPHC